MDEKINKKIIKINVTTFFFLWIIIFLAGADKPPPIGFLWLVFLILILDIALYLYLKRFLVKLQNNTKWIFAKNLFCFFLVAIIVSVLTIVSRINLMLALQPNELLLWVTSIIFAALINAICLYVFNIFLIKIYKKADY